MIMYPATYLQKHLCSMRPYGARINGGLLSPRGSWSISDLQQKVHDPLVVGMVHQLSVPSSFVSGAGQFVYSPVSWYLDSGAPMLPSFPGHQARWVPTAMQAMFHNTLLCTSYRLRPINTMFLWQSKSYTHDA